MNYLIRLKIYVIRRIKIFYLLKKKYYPCDFKNIWQIEPIFDQNENREEKITIFNIQIPNDDINWHKDYVSGYCYEIKQFDQIRFHKLFNKGIDVIFPWELSRCQFLISWAQNYRLTKDLKYYEDYKNIITDWIKMNPFLTGINWTSAMDVAIRATNWIIASELFSNELQKDYSFKNNLSISLQKHVDYILKFHGNRKNNHAIAQFSGLLFCSQFLSLPKSKKLEKLAIHKLEEFMKYQISNEGVSKELSIPYHRLVLECFAYSTILAKSRQLKFSKKYYNKLHLMFKFVASYIDSNGNAPQIGDNDSGRFLIFHDSCENDHSYLIELGETLFNYNFESQNKIHKKYFKNWLPKTSQENVEAEDVLTFSFTNYTESGFFLLKNEYFSILVVATKISFETKSIFGHNHQDIGSFTISYNGKQIFVDPGTYNYTRNLKARNSFRSINSHNISLPINLNIDTYSSDSFFGGFANFPIIKVLKYTPENISYNLCFGEQTIERSISINNKSLVIQDIGTDGVVSYLHTSLELVKIKGNIQSSDFILNSNAHELSIEKCSYSESYGHLDSNCNKIIIKSDKDNLINVNFF